MSKKKMVLLKQGQVQRPDPSTSGVNGPGGAGSEGDEGDENGPHYGKVQSKMDNLVDLMARQGLVDKEEVTVVVDEKFASDEANEAKSPPDDMAMSREDLRGIYGILSDRMNDRIVELLERLYGILKMNGANKEILARIEAAVYEAEEMEAMVAALDGLTRNCDDSEIRDPEYISRYLKDCMRMRAEGHKALRAGKKGS